MAWIFNIRDIKAFARDVARATRAKFNRQADELTHPKRFFAALSVFALLCALAACGKPIPPEKAAYVGEWQGTGVDLSIDQEGTVYYKRVRGNAKNSLELPLKEFQGDNFVVGVGPLSTTFLVSPPPHQVGSDWKMTVDGVELTKLKE